MWFKDASEISGLPPPKACPFFIVNGSLYPKVYLPLCVASYSYPWFVAYRTLLGIRTRSGFHLEIGTKNGAKLLLHIKVQTTDDFSFEEVRPKWNESVLPADDFLLHIAILIFRQVPGIVQEFQYFFA